MEDKFEEVKTLLWGELVNQQHLRESTSDKTERMYHHGQAVALNEAMRIVNLICNK